MTPKQEYDKLYTSLGHDKAWRHAAYKVLDFSDDTTSDEYKHWEKVLDLFPTKTK